MSFMDILTGKKETKKGFRWAYAGDLADGEITTCGAKTKCRLCGIHMKKGDKRFTTYEFHANVYRNVQKHFHISCAQLLILTEANRLLYQHDLLAMIFDVDFPVPREVRELFERKIHE